MACITKYGRSWFCLIFIFTVVSLLSLLETEYILLFFMNILFKKIRLKNNLP